MSPHPNLPAIPPIDPALGPSLRARIDALAKPPGSLGRIEELAIRLGEIQGSTEPRAEKAVLLLFAGDHGLNQDRVSAYPSAVTGLMVRTLLAGRASANAFAASVGAELRVVDAGVETEMAPHPDLIDARIRPGTRNAAREPAMTPAECTQALARGMEAAAREIGSGADVLAIGEMGIGNSASAALLAHRLLPAPLDECVGLGAGHDPEGLARKSAVLHSAAARADATAPFEVLREFGGYEIAQMAGVVLGAAARRTPVLVDGFIASAAALVAVRLEPAALLACIFAHRSAERGHALILEGLGASPLLDLGLRLGEGTGALLAVPLLRAACAMLRTVASLDEVLSGAV